MDEERSNEQVEHNLIGDLMGKLDKLYKEINELDVILKNMDELMHNTNFNEY